MQLLTATAVCIDQLDALFAHSASVHQGKNTIITITQAEPLAAVSRELQKPAPALNNGGGPRRHEIIHLGLLTSLVLAAIFCPVGVSVYIFFLRP